MAPSDPEVLSDQNQADRTEYEPSGEFAPTDPGAATDFAPPVQEGAAAYAEPVAWEDPAAPAAPESTVATSYSVTASYSSYSAEVTFSDKSAGSDVPAERAGSGVPAETAGSGVRAGHTAPGAPADDGAPAGHGQPAAGRRHPQLPVRPPGPAPHVLQARRRTLTMLIAITIAVMATALIGLVPWWTSVPPFVILGMYLLLLREAAHADAERARSWAEAHARAAAAEAAHAAQLARERARDAQVAPPPQPTAEIINISALAAEARDQPYDQYADAEIRAVGD
jgi:hypothetical protein